MPNIYDIAKFAGVSKTTVSKVINNLYGVKAETRTKVLEAIKELNYFPNHAARSLANRKTGVIGVVYNTFGMTFHVELSNFLQQYASENNYNLVFCNSRGDNATTLKHIDFLLSGSVDGIILYDYENRYSEICIRLKELNFPLVVIENNLDGLNINKVLIDNVEGARKAVNYLIDLGHKKIIHVARQDLTNSVPLERLNGYIKALYDNGLEFNTDYVIYCKLATKLEVEKAMDKLLNLKQKASAIFFNDDITAYRAKEYFINKGYKIPEDFSLVGFDNISSFNYIPISEKLVSMGRPVQDMANAAIEMLVNNINDRDKKPQSIVFETTLVEGKSCLEIKE
ncbi:MAG: LacI family DNA-binding transcriptional regulator [Clostridiaceae bacterium]|nr:LacI family DNA-binding transcriptional regulator [Clostridiaceae bacterium]